MNISGIYQIQSKVKPSRIYIGSSVCIMQRRYEHIGKLDKNKHKNFKLQNHYNKYGKSDLVFSILLGCPKEFLLTNEQFFIDSYNPWFNVHKKADSPLGLKRSEECKKRESESRMGDKNPFYNKKTQRNRMKKEENGVASIR